MNYLAKKKTYISWIFLFFSTIVYGYEFKNLFYKNLSIDKNKKNLQCKYEYYNNKVLKDSSTCKILISDDSIKITTVYNTIIITELNHHELRIDLNLKQFSYEKKYHVKKDRTLSTPTMLIYFYNDPETKFVQIDYKKNLFILSLEYGKFVIKIF